MLSEHPEARVDATKDDALYGGYMAAGATLDALKVRADFQSFIFELDLASRIQGLGLVGIELTLLLHVISQPCIATANWFTIDDSHVFHVAGELDEHVISCEVLHDTLKRMIQFHTSDPLSAKLVLHVKDFLFIASRFVYAL